MKKNGKILFVILFISIVSFAVLLIGDKPFKDTDILYNGDSIANITDENINKAKYFDIVYSGKTVEYDAYDFIIEKMSQAQYWTYDDIHPEYHAAINRDKPQYDDVIPNGTGWTLIDEDTATFARGFESRLVINFSENTAFNDPSYCDLDYLTAPHGEGVRWGNGRGANQSIQWEYYDLHNEPFQEESDSEEWLKHRRTYDFNNMLYNGNEILDKDTGRINSTIEFNSNRYNEIQETLDFYNKVFAELDIQILNQPKGTLSSYKGKKIQVPVELIELSYLDRHCDGKINSIFDERSGWKIHWEEDKNIPWLEDYRDVLNKEFPEVPEDSYITSSVTGERWAYYSPVFMYCANPNWFDRISNLYEGTQFLDPTKGDSQEETSALMLYYIKPLYEQIYGINGVYFVENNKVANGTQADAALTLEEFNEGIDLWHHNALAIYKAGDDMFGNANDMYMMDDYMNDLINYFKIDSPYGKDYVKTIRMTYEEGWQESLGLR